MKRLSTLFLSIMFMFGICPNFYAEASVQIDEQTINILEEYALAIPAFYGDSADTAEFARKFMLYFYGGSIYDFSERDYQHEVFDTNIPVYIVPDSDAEKDYRLVFGIDLPRNIKVDGCYIDYRGKMTQSPECSNSQYNDKYIVASGDFGDMMYKYSYSISDGKDGVYAVMNYIDCYTDDVYSSTVLHLKPSNNKNGFVIVSNTPDIPERNINVTINNNTLECNESPILINDTVFVPMRAIFESFNCFVDYDSNFKNYKHIITAANSDGTIQLKYDNNKIFDSFYVDASSYNSYSSKWDIYYTPANGTCKNLEFNASPFIENSTTFVPVRLIAETLGADVSWNGETKTVIINGNIPDAWGNAETVEKKSNLSYNDMLDIINGYCDKNNITPKEPIDIWDYIHGKGVVVGYDEDSVSYGLIYYRDGTLENVEAITFSEAESIGREVYNSQFNFMSDPEDYQYENGQYWSENDNAYLIGYCDVDSMQAYIINKYTKQVEYVGSFQDIWADAIPGFRIADSAL